MCEACRTLEDDGVGDFNRSRIALWKRGVGAGDGRDFADQVAEGKWRLCAYCLEGPECHRGGGEGSRRGMQEALRAGRPSRWLLKRVSLACCPACCVLVSSSLRESLSRRVISGSMLRLWRWCLRRCFDANSNGATKLIRDPETLTRWSAAHYFT